MKEIKEFESWYNKINNTDDYDDDFIWELAGTPYIEYHYSLCINKKLKDDDFKNELWYKFIEHDGAESFLLNKLENNEDKEFHGKIIFALGEIVDQKHGKQKEKVYDYAKNYTNSSNDNVRENAIIVLGWLGGVKDIELLGELLLNDKNNNCRAWSASAFMQIWFRKEDNIFVEKVLPYLYKSLQIEKDYFVISTTIETIRELTKKKYGITKMALNDLDKEKIDICKNKIIKYFSKTYENKE